MQEEAFALVFCVPSATIFDHFGQMLEQCNMVLWFCWSSTPSFVFIKLHTPRDEDFDPLASPEWVIALTPWHAHNEYVMKFSN